MGSGLVAGAGWTETGSLVLLGGSIRRLKAWICLWVCCLMYSFMRYDSYAPSVSVLACEGWDGDILVDLVGLDCLFVLLSRYGGVG